MMSLIYLGAYSQDYQISANGSQSVMACTTGDVYAWGCNGESSADGRLGVGNMSSSSIYRPTKVNMPAEAGKIQHVDGSSGAFLLAINCDGEVWIWGDNGSRQCGNTNATETIVKVPVYLMSGESNPSNPTAKLTGAKAISGGAGRLLEKIELFDIYEGAQIGEDKKSMAFNIKLASDIADVTDEMTDAVMEKVVKALGDAFGAQMRA